MSATERVRALLDERGWPWTSFGADRATVWATAHGFAQAIECKGNDGVLGMIMALTPERAVEATLGREQCHVDEVDTIDCVCDQVGRDGKPITVHVIECDKCGGTYEHVNGGYEFCPRCGRRIEVVDE